MSKPAPAHPNYKPESGASDQSKSRLSRDLPVMSPPIAAIPPYPITVGHFLRQSVAATDLQRLAADLFELVSTRSPLERNYHFDDGA